MIISLKCHNSLKIDRFSDTFLKLKTKRSEQSLNIKKRITDYHSHNDCLTHHEISHVTIKYLPLVEIWLFEKHMTRFFLEMFIHVVCEMTWIINISCFRYMKLV